MLINLLSRNLLPERVHPFCQTDVARRIPLGFKGLQIGEWLIPQNHPRKNQHGEGKIALLGGLRDNALGGDALEINASWKRFLNSKNSFWSAFSLPAWGA